MATGSGCNFGVRMVVLLDPTKVPARPREIAQAYRKDTLLHVLQEIKIAFGERIGVRRGIEHALSRSPALVGSTTDIDARPEEMDTDEFR
jgi:hypothetical protein